MTLPYPDHFILASTSPRRRQFMEALAIPFTVIPPGAASDSRQIDETPYPNERPGRLVRRLSRLKAQTIARHLPAIFPQAAQFERLVIVAADTEVALNDKILGKPANPAEAGQMLRQLRRQPHVVYSGLTLAAPASSAGQPAQYVTRLHQSQVRMRPYTDAEIRAYVATGSPLDKAGAYGIQDQPFAPVAQLDGCFASVMGFPLGELAAGLRELGLGLPPVAPLCQQLTGTPCCQQNN